jgi:predicted nuclease with TOPRIM domain
MEDIIKVEDRNTITNIVFKFPELMREDAEEIVKERYSYLTSLQDKLQKARSEVRSLEEEVKRETEEWRTLQDIVSYSHPTSEKIIKVETCGLTIQGHGNDIIGKTTVM